VGLNTILEMGVKELILQVKLVIKKARIAMFGESDFL
jgi:hypothetical protein